MNVEKFFNWHQITSFFSRLGSLAAEKRVETVEKVKFEGAILSEALKCIGMKIMIPYGRKYAKRGMVGVCDGQA